MLVSGSALQEGRVIPRHQNVFISVCSMSDSGRSAADGINLTVVEGAQHHSLIAFASLQPDRTVHRE